ncbi:MAG: Gx transporter family protein [Defluviitaleaceae bacterium]|nr:Gx transporter family protein [Defluviitaleaceae bacterium]
MSQTNLNTKKIAFLGLMLALIIVLLMIERMLPPLPFLPPNFKLGLSNIIVMYSLFFIGKKEVFFLVVLKAFFNTLMRGPIGGLLGLSGGLLSVIIIILITWIFKKKASYVALSIAGAIFHNIGQLIVASIILQNRMLILFYLPAILIAGTILGTLTGVLLKVIMPIFDRVYGRANRSDG